MSCTEQIQLILEEFGKAIGLEGLALDETGYCCLTFDDNIFVSIESDDKENRMLMYSFLGSAKSDQEADSIYGKVLDGNFFWRSTQGATLSRDPGSGGIVLMDKIELRDMNYPRFEKALENFVNTTESWMRKLDSMQGEGKPSSEEDTEGHTIQEEKTDYDASMRV